jgi:DNA-binding XRE family transcriptional regulator
VSSIFGAVDGEPLSDIPMSPKPAARTTLSRTPAGENNPEEAVWGIRNAKRLRTDGKGAITQAKLAEEAGVGDDTVSKIERGIGVSRRMVNKVFEALNVHHDGKLKHEHCVIQVL